MQRIARRSFLIWSLGAKNNGLFYLQIEEIGALNAAFAILDRKPVKDGSNRSVITGNGFNPRELPH